MYVVKSHQLLIFYLEANYYNKQDECLMIEIILCKIILQSSPMVETIKFC